jgi:hypothetical protein
METAFETTYGDAIIGKLTAIDRLIFHGHLMCFFRPGAFETFLWQQQVLLKDFKGYVSKATTAIRDHALKMAAEAHRPYIHLNHFAGGKDEMAKKIAKRDGITDGLICVLSTLELNGSFDVQANHRTHKLEIVRRQRKCLHLYFYFIDAEFGFMHVRLQSWFPFNIQVYINGREWLARQLERRGVAFQRYENALLDIEDLALAQELSTRLARRKWPRVLDAFARRVNVWLPIIQRFDRGYYWVTDQCEIATDIMWKDRSRLAAIMPDLFDHAIRTFSAKDVMRFLGRTCVITAEVVSDDKRVPTTRRGRPEGRRVKHRVAQNWIKFYDKWSVLRVETVINKPSDFRILRVVKTPRGRKTRRWMPMRKGVANLWRYLEVGRQANERYLGALAHARVRGKAVAELDSLCQSRVVEGKRYGRFNPVSDQDCALFAAVLAGEHAIQGFRNRAIGRRLYPKPSTSPEESKRRCARVSRLIAKLRGHGLVAKVPKSRLYRVTSRGQRLMSAALRYRDSGLPVAQEATAA